MAAAIYNPKANPDGVWLWGLGLGDTACLRRGGRCDLRPEYFMEFLFEGGNPLALTRPHTPAIRSRVPLREIHVSGPRLSTAPLMRSISPTESTKDDFFVRD